MLYTAVWSPLGTPWTHHTLSEKQSKFPRYNMKWSGKHYTTREIFRVVSRFLRYISCYIAENRFPFGQCCSTGQVGNFLRKDDSCDRTLVIYRTVHCTVFIFMPGDDTNYAAGWVPQSMVHVLRSLGMICDFFYPFLSLHSKQSTFRDHDLQMHLEHTCSHVMVNMFVICRCKLTAWDGLYHDFWER